MDGYPDLDTLLADWLKAPLGITQIHVGGPEDIPGSLPTIVPLLMVDTFGGSDTVITLDRANVDIDVYASGLEPARAIAEQVRRLIRTQLVGQILGGAAVITRTETISRPTRLPWNASAVRRVGAAYRITQHAAI